MKLFWQNDLKIVRNISIFLNLIVDVFKKMTNNFTFFSFEKKLYMTTFTKIMFDNVKHSFDVCLIFWVHLISEIWTTFFLLSKRFSIFILYAWKWWNYSLQNDNRWICSVIFSKLILNLTFVLWRIDDVFTFSFIFWR